MLSGGRSGEGTRTHVFSACCCAPPPLRSVCLLRLLRHWVAATEVRERGSQERFLSFEVEFVSASSSPLNGERKLFPCWKPPQRSLPACHGHVQLECRQVEANIAPKFTANAGQEWDPVRRRYLECDPSAACALRHAVKATQDLAQWQAFAGEHLASSPSLAPPPPHYYYWCILFVFHLTRA